MASSLPSDSPLSRRMAANSSSFHPSASPMQARSRKVTSPASLSASMVSASDHLSSLREGNSTSLLSSQPLSVSNSSLDTTCSLDTPQPTPTLGRREFPGLSRSSSNLSLASTSSQRLSPIDSIIKHLRERLVGALFSGWYTERRWIEAVERYRDSVTVDPVESKVIRQVNYAIRKSGKILPENSFIGLSNVDDECRLFLSLGPGGVGGEASHAFGHYWFHIRGVSFIQGLGFNIEVGVIRPYVTSDNQSCWKCKQRENQEVEAEPVKIDSVQAALGDMRTRLVAMSKDLMTEAWDPSSWWASLRPLLTPTNFVAAMKFLFVLLLAAFTGLVAGGKQVANWSLKAIHELAFLVDRSTPFALGALNMLSKVVGGFYVLLAMIWRDVRKPKPPPAAVPPSLQGPSPSLPPPRPLQHIPSQVRQRPPSAHAAMDTMYSQGRAW